MFTSCRLTVCEAIQILTSRHYGKFDDSGSLFDTKVSESITQTSNTHSSTNNIPIAMRRIVPLERSDGVEDRSEHIFVH